MTVPGNVNRTTLSAFLLHLHPRKVHSETLRFTLSFGLGGMAATLLGLLFVSGILQLLSYSPQIDNAYLSVQLMYGEGEVAGYIRNIHHWSGNVLVVVAFLHMLRVYLTGALTDGRRFNWLIGIVLFCTILFANFTGYLLPWDQLAYWAVTIFTSMVSYIPIVGEQMSTMLRGGAEVGGETLAIFFAIHVGILPVIIFLFSIYHFWLIRKAGGLIRQQSESAQATLLPSNPHLISKELGVGFALIALVLLFSALVDAPLDLQANPGESPNPAKAAWYFLGLQELLLHLHPVFAICVVPGLLILGLIGVAYAKDVTLSGGIWFGGRSRGKKAAIWSTLMGGLVVLVFVLADNFFINGHAGVGVGMFVRGLLPIVSFCGVLVCWFYLWRNKFDCNRPEATMAVAILVFSSSLVFTAVGIWFRGKEMSLIWPF
jgi:quinol-cytochrome oxidoreductase complex cytochrome b subunit